MRTRRKSGNTLALVLVTLGVMLAMFAFFILNLNQLTGVHKETMNATDSAALQVVVDMCRIVVDGPLGRIGLVDDPASTTSAHPVKSINTIYAELRLNALVASKLSDNSKNNILYLVKHDLSLANTARDILRDKLVSALGGGANAYDKNGTAINVVANAKRIYDENQHRMGRDSSTSYTILIDPGTVNAPAGTGETTTNMPYGDNAQSASGDVIAYSSGNCFVDNANRRCYRPDVDYPVPGVNGTNVRFVPMTWDCRLVPNGSFRTTTASEIPVAVRVTVSEGVKGIAPHSKVRPTTAIRTVAYAQCGGGGGGAYVPATGTLLVGFGAGFPTEPGNGLTFNKGVDGIMNASTLDNSGTSTYANWNAPSKGNWFTASNGPVPGNGSLVATNYKGIAGKANDDPSISLAFLTYDWLKSVSLRANPDALVKALKADIKAYALSGNSSPNTYTSHNNDWVPPAYAETGRVNGTTTPALIISESMRDPTGSDDPRNLLRWMENQDAYQRQQARMWGYLPADPVIGPRAYMGVLTDDGRYVTMDGNPGSDMFQMTNEMMLTNQRAIETFKHGIQAFAKLYNDATGKPGPVPDLNTESEFNEALEREKTKEGAQVLADHPRLDHALNNACYVSATTTAMYDNLKALTGGGVRKVNERHYVVMGSNFYPIGRAATVQDLLTDGPISTGQDPSAPAADWGVATQKVGNEFKSKLEVFKHEGDPAIGHLDDSQSHILQPAYAQSAKPNNNFKLLFKVDGGTIKTARGTVLPNGSGNIKLFNVQTTPFANVPIAQGQASYQNSQAIIIKEKDGSTVTWQVQGRDLNANAYPATTGPNSPPPNPSSAAKHYSAATSYDKAWCSDPSGCPVLASEWAVTCPVVKPPPPPPPPPPPAVPPYTPPPNPCAGSYWVSRRWVCGYFGWMPIECCTLEQYNGCGQLIGSAHS
ncbi:MAG: hypothetical protein K2Y22_12525 [Candidatus Obscuribacterales bacterium]|nr:hypothetical protein [Candidatus Obscuribacterales bacterium]